MTFSLAIVLGILATYRISRMIAFEDGPYDLLLKLRSLIYTQWQGHQTDGTHWTWRGINCPLCLSVWIGACIALFLPWTTILDYGLTALALSGGATWLYKQERR